MNNKIMLLDGSMSYPLEKLGYNLNKKLWTGDALINNPDIIKNIHKEYVNAGADFISTSTYQVSYDSLNEMGYSLSEIKNILKKSVDITRYAIDETIDSNKVKVVGSFGPFASYKSDASEYEGIYQANDDEIINYHANNINLINQLELDIVLFETIPCLREIKILVDLLPRLDKEVWVSMTCNEEINFRDNSSIDHACELIEKIGNVSTIGMNCFSPLLVEKVIEKLKRLSSKKILIYPNSGEVYDPIRKKWYGENKFDNNLIKKWLSLSPDIIGGCCRIGDDVIKLMREEIDNQNNK